MSTNLALFWACPRLWSIAFCRFVTVFGGAPNVDVLIAPPEVIAALPGMTPAILNDFLKQRPYCPGNSCDRSRARAAQANAAIPKGKSFVSWRR